MTTKGRPQAIAPEHVHACQASGMTQQQAADALGVSLSTVRKNWKRAETRGRPSANADQVAALVAAGLKTGEIAARLGIDRTTVSRIKQKLARA
ncbi:helix-turn-helix domain-containing protein [Citrobacter portucalensis]|uniref:helix-turn-helix domain-containing protein n=1 Tax=Citrobacter portucalensis TaxID=1639133 RepID=UPI00226B7253|nr:helix-turn-helix domain-containing protein [Citrobacter portucalensis]MCX8985146.1 helix-turn-helix domain-containing protein [Citrobacter portucalensis]